MRSDRKKCVAVQRVQLEEAAPVDLQPAEQTRASAGFVGGLPVGCALWDGTPSGVDGELAEAHPLSMQCSNSS